MYCVCLCVYACVRVCAYVHVRHTYHHCVGLVKATDTDWALQGYAVQSSTLGEYSADKAVGASSSTIFSDGQCSGTEKSYGAWWKLYFKRMLYVVYVTVSIALGEWTR